MTNFTFTRFSVSTTVEVTANDNEVIVQYAQHKNIHLVHADACDYANLLHGHEVGDLRIQRVWGAHIELDFSNPNDRDKADELLFALRAHDSLRE